MSYEQHYDEPLLDGLHNYFPEVLYGQPERFGGAAPLVSYVQSQVQQRFDLFSAGRRSFVPISPAVPITPQRTTRVETPPPLPRVRRYNEASFAATYVPLFENTNTLNMLSTLFNIPLQQPNMDPVVVHPTREQVEAGTTIVTVEADGEMCAICQDSIPSGSEARNLTGCGHSFHVGCIDTWYLRDVRCPTCRHDVREAVAST
jgi:hypothetical protein